MTRNGFQGVGLWMVALIVAATVTSSALATVNIEWRPEYSSGIVGDTIEIGVYAVSDSPEPQAMSGLTVIMEWDATALELVGVVNNSPYSWLAIGFPDDVGLDGINVDWTDGDAFLQAMRALPPDPAPVATQEGLLVGTLVFDAIDAGYCLQIETVAQLGNYTETEVIDGIRPGVNIVGSLSDAFVTVGTCLPAGDFNNDCDVNLTDYSQFIWWITGPVLLPEADGCGYGDFDDDGDVDLRDIAAMQNTFGG